MKAVVSQANDATESVEIPRPTPDAGEVLLKVQAATINPVDVHVRSLLKTFGLEQGQPVGLGWDVVGEIVEVGPGVSLEVGSRVAAVQSDGVAKSSGTLAEYAVLPAEVVAEVPVSLDSIAAATLPMNSLTAAQGLDLLGEAAGRKLLITGAAGAVGGFALVLARRLGFKVTGLARASDADFVRSTGASFSAALTEGEFDAVFDAASLGSAVFVALRDGGAYSGVQPGNVPTAERGIGVQAVQVVGDGPRLAEFLRLAESGEFELRVAGSFGFEQAAEVANRLSRGGQRGRWVLVP
ncbi:NADP-dependent oxidoreductase [Psychromicrobium lacuslunae]|uniref:Enoyl reductase (ER) domain-containing protein n=1 Tax=Psychromicrobium lacuslunae TaxID=1618207 RepID=A0A0D4C0G0_9MICC|nr:NADP-dependent oxidoreductase [Psychromicrobium lacuslunae]AJT41905.1 hypothetical protein UM93_10960 [Psychromicrobium lacuslunae]